MELMRFHRIHGIHEKYREEHTFMKLQQCMQIYAPSLATSSGSAEALPGDAAVVFVFFVLLLMAEGVWGIPVFDPAFSRAIRSPERQEPPCPSTCFYICSTPGLMGLLALHRGDI